jgi:hypothetical protein
MNPLGQGETLRLAAAELVIAGAVLAGRPETSVAIVSRAFLGSGLIAALIVATLDSNQRLRKARGRTALAAGAAVASVVSCVAALFVPPGSAFARSAAGAVALMTMVVFAQLRGERAPRSGEHRAPRQTGMGWGIGIAAGLLFILGAMLVQVGLGGWL